MSNSAKKLTMEIALTLGVSDFKKELENPVNKEVFSKPVSIVAGKICESATKWDMSTNGITSDCLKNGDIGIIIGNRSLNEKIHEVLVSDEFTRITQDKDNKEIVDKYQIMSVLIKDSSTPSGKKNAQFSFIFKNGKMWYGAMNGTSTIALASFLLGTKWDNKKKGTGHFHYLQSVGRISQKTASNVTASTDIAM